MIAAKRVIKAGGACWHRCGIMLRRTELAPASLLTHAAILDNILLAGTENELMGRRFPGEVAAAVAAMLVHLAQRQPLVLLATTADLLRGRTGVQPPPQIVELVLRQTGGCPQLINSTQLQVPPDGEGTAAWAVGKLDAEGLRVLESTIRARPEAACTVLQAAALCAVDADIEPDVIAAVTNLDPDLVERVLDDERDMVRFLLPGFLVTASSMTIGSMLLSIPAPRPGGARCTCGASSCCWLIRHPIPGCSPGMPSGPAPPWSARRNW